MIDTPTQTPAGLLLQGKLDGHRLDYLIPHTQGGYLAKVVVEGERWQIGRAETPELALHAALACPHDGGERGDL